MPIETSKACNHIIINKNSINSISNNQTSHKSLKHNITKVYGHIIQAHNRTYIKPWGHVCLFDKFRSETQS